MQLIDTHVHLNFEVFQTDIEALRHRWQTAGVAHLVHSCVEPAEFTAIRALADRFPEISFAVGLHPLDADKWTTETAGEIYNLAQSDKRVVAIGEMGLDFYKADNQAQQQEALEAQLAIAQQLDKAVIIHCREAAPALREILQAGQPSSLRGVMHCWGGTPEETRWFLDLGFYISFSGIITFKNAETIRAAAQIVPRDRLLVETDCPFLSPVPHRGKRNEPAYVRHVAECLAQVRQVPLEDLAAQTTANARQLFGINEL
jgi:TatD DNase family protein